MEDYPFLNYKISACDSRFYMISAFDSRSIYLKVCDASLLVNDLQMSMVDGHQNKKQKQDLDHILSIFFLNQMAIKPF